MVVQCVLYKEAVAFGMGKDVRIFLTGPKPRNDHECSLASGK